MYKYISLMYLLHMYSLNTLIEQSVEAQHIYSLSDYTIGVYIGVLVVCH